MSFREASFHQIHESSIDDRITNPNSKPQEYHKLEIDESLLSETGGKLDVLSFELRKLLFINEELLFENELWKQQYQKFQDCDKGANFNMHDIYQQNFITTINDLERDLTQKEQKLTIMTKTLKILEKENNILKSNLENKGSPTIKKDVVKRIEELERVNFLLNNKLDQAIFERKRNMMKLGGIFQKGSLSVNKE